MSTVKANNIEPASGGTVTITGAALTTPALGTPASGTLTNCTGLPASAVVNTPAGGISATTVQAALEELDSEKFAKSGGTITGMTACDAGLKLTGAATLAAAAAREWSYEHPVTRYYFGDGTGYSIALSKRVSSTTTDLFTLTDSGDLTLTGAGSFAGVVSTGGSLPSTGYGASFVSGLSTGRLTSGGTAGRVTSIATYFDDVAIEVCAGSSSSFKTGLVLGAQNYNGTAGEGVSIYVRGNRGWAVDANLHWVPATDNTSNAGSATYAIKQIYSNNSVIVTSDARLKTARPYTDKERAVARRCRDLGVVYQWNSAIEEKGADKARLHFGTTVQSVIAAFEAEGLDPMRYGVVCYDKWEAEVIHHPAVEAREATPAVPAQYETRESREVAVVDGKEIELVRTYLHEVSPAQPAMEAVGAADAWTETVREAGNRYSLRLDQLAFFIATAGAGA